MVDVKSEQPAPAPTRRETLLAVTAAAAAALGLAAFAGLDAGAWARCALATAACWWLARRLGLGALGALFAAVSFGGSAAVLAGAPPGYAGVSEAGPFELGVLLIVAALVSGWRRAPRSPWMTVLSVLSVAALLLAALRLLGAPWLALVPEAFGAPGQGHGYLGAGDFAARVAPWVPVPTLALALAGALSATGRLRVRDAVAVVGFGAFLAAVSGLLPVAPTALPAALFLALLAGDGVESAPRAARVAAALTVVLLVVATIWVDAELLDQPRITGDPPDELVVLTEPPAEHYVGLRGTLHVAGEVRPPVGARSVRASLERLETGDRFVRLESPPLEVDAQRAPDGTLRFRMRELDMRRLTNGIWRWSLDVHGEQGERLGTRDSDSFAVRHVPQLSPVTLLALVVVLSAAAVRGRGSRVVALGLLVIAVLQVLDFATLL